MECYNFYQQCKDHFATTGATRPNQILFATIYLQEQTNFRWQQYNRKLEGKSLVLISWNKFKAFLRKALGNPQAFVDSYWVKIKHNS